MMRTLKTFYTIIKIVLILTGSAVSSRLGMEVVPFNLCWSKEIGIVATLAKQLWKEFGTFILIPQTKAYKLIKKQMMTNYHESLGVTRDVFGDRMRKRLRRATDDHTKMVNQFLGKRPQDYARKLLGKRSIERKPLTMLRESQS